MNFPFYWKIAMLIGSRYLILAGIAFLCWYVIFKNGIFYKKIQTRVPQGKDYLREIGYSLLTIAIFASVPMIILKNPAIAKHTMYYTDIDLHGKWYFFLAFPMLFILHDTYFYWMHRLMHHRKLFRLIHVVHHESTNPSPWAAYSFHPLEAVVEAGIFAVFLFIMPVHPLHLGIFFFAMIVYNVYGHLGYELYPGGFNRHWFGKWINTSISHNQHHQYFKGNYGLYFTVWDRLMGTLRTDYDTRFDEVTARHKR